MGPSSSHSAGGLVYPELLAACPHFTLLHVVPSTCLSPVDLQSMDSSDLSDGPITLQEYLEVKKALASSEAKVQQLMKVNNNLSEELRRLQKEVRGRTRRHEGEAVMEKTII